MCVVPIMTEPPEGDIDPVIVDTGHGLWFDVLLLVDFAYLVWAALELSTLFILLFPVGGHLQLCS